MTEPVSNEIRPLLVRDLADPAQYALDQAIAETRQALEQGVSLLEQFEDVLDEELNRGAGNTTRLRRILDLLAALDMGRAAVHVRSVLLSHPDPYVRSKAAVILSGASRDFKWIERRMLDADPRVQANIIESIWGIDSPETRELLRTAAGSIFNRLAAKALVGMYRIGDVSSIGLVFAMAEDPREDFRISARWAMGEMCDPRFLPWLNTEFRTAGAKHRATVLRALSRIRRRLSDCEKAGCMRLVPGAFRVAGGGLRSVAFTAYSKDCDDAPPLSPVQFVIYENGRQVTDYSVSAQPDPDLLVAGFSVPRILSHSDPYAIAIASGLNSCLGLKRTQDLWAFDRYARDGSAGSAEVASLDPDDPDPVILDHIRRNRGLLNAPEIIAKAIQGPGGKDLASSDIVAGASKLIAVMTKTAGARHLFLCFDPERPPSPEEVSLIEFSAAQKNVTVHGIVPDSARDMQEIRAICRIRGTFRSAPVEAAGTRLAEAMEGLLHRYTISWMPESPAQAPGEMKIQVFSELGSGEVMFAG